MSNPFHYSELLYPLTKGDTAGHPFHGNQFTAGQGGGAKDTADKIMDAVNKYGDENPNAQMNKGWQTVMEQAKMIGEHKMAIPKSLVDSATKEDLDKLTDNNYHSARTAIEQQRPDLLTPSAREVNLGNYFKSELLLYPLSKGDVAGHAFHGNQYQNSGSIKDAAVSLSKKTIGEYDSMKNAVQDARDSADMKENDFDQKREELDQIGLRGENVNGDGHRTIADAHKELADANRKMAQKIRDDNPKKADIMARRYERAAAAHDFASRSNIRAGVAADKLGTAMVEHGNNDVDSGSSKVDDAQREYKTASISSMAESNEADFKQGLAHQYAPYGK